MPDVDDDICITLALLHGAEMYHATNTNETGLWYMLPLNDVHPLERQHQHARRDGDCGFETRADLARAYCEHFGLI